MWLELPRSTMDKSNSCFMQSSHFPYSIDFYGEHKEEGIRTLKATVEEIHDLVRRYAIVYPSAIATIEKEKYTEFRCLVNDETAGISRGILERIGYTLEESDFTPYGIYWITLRTRIEKRKKR